MLEQRESFTETRLNFLVPRRFYTPNVFNDDIFAADVLVDPDCTSSALLLGVHMPSVFRADDTGFKEQLERFYHEIADDKSVMPLSHILEHVIRQLSEPTRPPTFEDEMRDRLNVQYEQDSKELTFMVKRPSDAMDSWAAKTLGVGTIDGTVVNTALMAISRPLSRMRPYAMDLYRATAQLSQDPTSIAGKFSADLAKTFWDLNLSSQ